MSCFIVIFDYHSYLLQAKIDLWNTFFSCLISLLLPLKELLYLWVKEQTFRKYKFYFFVYISKLWRFLENEGKIFTFRRFFVFGRRKTIFRTLCFKFQLDSGSFMWKKMPLCKKARESLLFPSLSPTLAVSFLWNYWSLTIASMLITQNIPKYIDGKNGTDTARYTTILFHYKDFGM